MTCRSNRAYTSPWTSSNTAPAIKKRHSVDSTPSNSQIPKPGRTSTDNDCSRRSSTVNGVVVAAWEILPSQKTLGDAPSIKSRTSSLGLSMRTGPVEEVAPWELYPVPHVSPSLLTKASTLKKTAHKINTRPVGEVTPWELSSGSSQPNDNPVSPVSPKQSSSGPPVSPLAHPLPNLEYESVPVYPRSTATGPTEDVTPWELTPAPAEGEVLESSGHVSPSRTMNSLSLTMAQLEEVTPWELYPAPRSSGSILSSQTQVPTNRPPSTSSSKPTSEIANWPRKRAGSKTSKNPRISIPAIGILNIAHECTGQQKGLLNGVSSTSDSLTSNPQRQLKCFMTDREILEQLKTSIQAREAQFVVKGIGNLVVGGGQSRGKRHHLYPANEVPYPRSYEREVVDLDVWETMFCLDICKNVTWHVFETPPTKVLELGCGTGTWILHCAKTWKECHFVGLDIVSIHPDLRNVDPDLASRITWVQHNFLDGLPFQNEEFDFVHIKRIALGVPEDKWDKFFEEIARVMKPGAAFEMVEEDLFFPGKHINEGDDFLSPITTDWNSMSPPDLNGFPPTRGDDTFDAGSPETPTTNTTLLPRTPSRSNSPTHGPAEKEVMVNEDPISCDSFPSPSLPAITTLNFPIMSKEQSPISPLQQPPCEMEPLCSEAGTSPAGFGLSTISLSSAMETVNEAIMGRTRSSSVQTSTTTLNSAASPDSELKALTKPSPLLLQMMIQTPTNPRDHTLLETIWNEMLSSRWVNSSPLSLLKTYLEWHFKDVHTHPPLMYTFPPTPRKSEPADDDSDSDSDTENAINVSHNDEKERQSPYVTLDETRGHALSPSQHTGKRMSRLPTTALNIDLRTLNLHLELRAKEIIACSESMWEWVKEFQRAYVPNFKANGTLDMTRCAILEMTRDDFDLLLNNFTLDLQDQAALGHVLQERFDLHVFRSRRLQDRKAFDKACKKYQRWVVAERVKSTTSVHKANGDTRKSMPNIIPQYATASTVISRSHSSPESSFQNPVVDPVIRPSAPLSPCASHLSIESKPTQRLSRSMRVFVAWKASS